jgi:hypothetical protein
MSNNSVCAATRLWQSWPQCVDENVFQKAWNLLHREADVPERVMMLDFITKGHKDVRNDLQHRLECWKRNLDIVTLNHGEFWFIGTSTNCSEFLWTPRISPQLTN